MQTFASLANVSLQIVRLENIQVTRECIQYPEISGKFRFVLTTQKAIPEIDILLEFKAHNFCLITTQQDSYIERLWKNIFKQTCALANFV